MLDKLHINLSTKLLRGLVTRLIRKAIKKATGYEIDIQLNNLVVETTVEGKIQFHADVDASMKTEEFVNMISEQLDRD